MTRVHGIHMDHKCTDCNSSFTTPKGLKAHVQKVHTADRNRYPCLQCKKAFPDKYKLDRHVEGVHVNAKNYVCDRCPKQFSVHAQLKRHVDQVGVRGKRLLRKLVLMSPKILILLVVFFPINIYRFTRAFADTTVIFAKEASSKHKSFVLTSWLCTRT